jgi:hypothetical protein
MKLIAHKFHATIKLNEPNVDETISSVKNLHVLRCVWNWLVPCIRGRTQIDKIPEEDA